MMYNIYKSTYEEYIYLGVFPFAFFLLNAQNRTNPI